MVIVTDHARERILERIGCSPRKIQRVAEKAWAAKIITNPEVNRAQYKAEAKYGKESTVVREYQGRPFVFAREKNRVVLVTVYG